MIGSAIEEEIGLPKWLNGKKSACQASRPVSSLVQEMATLSSMLAWEIPWTKEAGRL